MDRARELLRSGAWLTRERVRLIAAAVLIASAAGFLYLVVTAHGLIDQQGRPLGTDFSDVYAAGTYVLDGNPEAPFDLARQHAREQQIFGEATPFYGWHYPPFFLFVAGSARLHALRDRARGLAGRHALPLSPDDPRDPRRSPPSPPPRSIARIKGKLIQPLIRSGSCSHSLSPRCSSISVMARMDSSPPLCSARRWSNSTVGHC